MHCKEAPVSLELGSCWASAGDSLFTRYRLEVAQNHPLVVGICCRPKQKVKAATYSLDLVAHGVLSRQCLDSLEQGLV